MDAADKRMLEREALRNMIQQWNANRLDLFALSEPNESLEFHGVMRFYFQDSGQKIATKCIRVASDATVSDVIETLIEKFRPDMRMLSLGSYSLWETHGPDDERKLEPHEKPLLVQLNWHADDREGRFLLKCLSTNEVPISSVNEKGDQNFKRKLSKREKKELKKKEKLSRLKSDTNDENRPVAEKLYTELPETSFMRSISNPEAVMRRRRQQKLGRKLQQFKSKDGGPDTGGTLRVYGSILRPDVSYVTLLLSINDTAATVLRDTLDKYGMSYQDPQQFCIVQEDKSDNSEYILEDDECPLALMNMTRSSIMFHVRRRPADAQPRRRKKKTGVGAGPASSRPGNEPMLVEVAPDASTLENGRRVKINDVVEVGSGNGTNLQLYGPSIQSRHCVVAPADGGGYSVTPLHADAQVYVNGKRIMRTQRLQHGCLLKFGRVSTFRFVDPAQENIINRNLAQSQHYGSGSIYDRSPTSPGETSGAMSPTSMTSHQPDPMDSNANTTNDTEYQRTMSPVSQDAYYRSGNDMPPYNNNNNTLKLDNESLMMSQHLSDSKDDYAKDDHPGSVYNDQDIASMNRTANSQYKDNYETTFDLDGNVETKSICSAKSGGSGHDHRMLTASTGVSAARPGQEPILPAVLEFPEAGQQQFLAAVITRLDPHAPAFKLAPVYTLYLCARYRASTHYRAELTPTERAHKLTAFLHHVATLIHATVQERCADSAAQAFWMANASELLHFLKYDRHISSFSTQAQELLAMTVQNAFSNLVTCFQEELSRGLATLTSPSVSDATDATAPTLQALAAAMVLLRRCRVNAALTIQLFSHLFHYINAVCFNKLVSEAGTVSAQWGAALSARLALLAAWAERQGLELAADCHLARTHQAARLIQGEYRTAEEVRAALATCFKLNSVQVRALLTPIAPPDVVEAGVAHAYALADELCRADGREIRLEESEWLGAGLLIPSDGFSAEVVRGVPPGLAEFVAPLQRGGLCRLGHQHQAIGVWTVYMGGHNAQVHQPRRAPDARVQIIQLNKNSNGMGLSIVAAKGAGQTKLGIYIKSVVPGGAAAADGRLAAGDQLLSVDGQSLVGITQEKAAEYLVRTGPTVTLEVAKQGAMLHGLATLLHQPTYNQRQDEEVQYEDRARRNSGTFTNLHPALLRPASPRTELATAGYGRRPCHNRCQLLRDESTESSTDDSDDYHHDHQMYHGSIPRLIVTLDRENDQLQEDLSPDTPGCPLELKCGPGPPGPIPIFTFTCEDFDEQHSEFEESINGSVPEVPPPIPDPPANYDQNSDNGEICLPPKMKPIDTKLTLDFFKSHAVETDLYRRRCTGIDECVSACECCRTPQPEAPQIPYIDEPAFEPVIFENDVIHNKVATPKIRRILPSLSIDQADDKKPVTVDAVCQTVSSPVERVFLPTPIDKTELNLDLDGHDDTQQIKNIHCRLKRTLFGISKSFSGKSEDTEIPSTYSTSESFDETTFEKQRIAPAKAQTPVEACAKQILDSVDRKSWKSPDEYRPAFGSVKALTKHFNSINLTYCVKNYKRNCQSSPNLCGRVDKTVKLNETISASASLANLQYESIKTNTSETKLSDDEVKSILIQLEDWSRYGSRGSEDTLAHGNEFEIPNLPSEDHTDNTSNSYIFNEIVDKKPRRITLDNIKLISNQSSVHSDQQISKESLARSESLERVSEMRVSKDQTKQANENTNSPSDSSPSDVSSANMSCRLSVAAASQSCPDVRSGSERGRVACTRAASCLSCPSLAAVRSSSGTGATGAVRRASERDLPSRLAAEPVKSSKSVPALHHVTSPPPHLPHQTHQPPPQNNPGHAPSAVPTAAWPTKSRSSHNLTAHHDGFYQNLASVQQHALQDRWSSLRSSTGSNRPQSAHFMAPPQSEGTDSPLHQQLHAQMNQASAANVRAAKLAEMSEELTRRQQHPYPNSGPHNPPAIGPHSQQYPHGAMGQAGPHGMASPPPHPQSPLAHQIYHNQHAPPQRYEWHPPGPPSPQRSQPPVAPKPQGPRRQDVDPEELLHLHSHPQPQQPTSNSVLPEDERYVASALEPPAMSVYPASGSAGNGGGAAAQGRAPHNPWQREERERQAEARRQHARARRDAAIAQLLSLGASRTPVQNQQLRSLQLERDFELRATQHDQEEGGAAEGSDDEEEAVDEEPQSPPPPASPRTMSPPPQPMHLQHPPKSILKTNTRSEVTNGYATEMVMTTTYEESRMSEVTSSVGNLSVGSGPSNAPPPPARGSSFAVMAERARTLSPQRNAEATHPVHAAHAGYAHHAAPQSPVGVARDKRVSFHERATPAAAAPAPAPPAPPTSSPPPLHDLPREDPDRFIEEAESMLAEPTSPAANSMPSGIAAHTPGVIGAQEVYRDPRTRRLAEQQARAAAPAVPEQLSFKEKMKMFALEAGDQTTPKDKVKISRAQRDIDAVH